MYTGMQFRFIIVILLVGIVKDQWNEGLKI